MTIVEHYENCLRLHGDSHLGVDWPKAHDAETRYNVMLDVIRTADQPVSLLDFGCGAAHLYDLILDKQLTHIEYSGLDLSPEFINLCESKHSTRNFYCHDILTSHETLPEFDYVVMNGVFTEKRDLTFEEMLKVFQNVVSAVFHNVRIGMAFNVMSTHVDWERQDLFHLPMDRLADFLCQTISRNFVIRNDYGLYEYTAYVYR